MPTEKLLFIDTNIWLDFYRAHNDAGLKLLNHVEAVRDKLIVTYQLEVEFKKNRQQVLIDSWSNLKPPVDLGVPNIVADAQTSTLLKRHMKEAKKRVDSLKKLVIRAMASPARYDPVYQAVQRIFHRNHELVLSRKIALRRTIRNKALRRFLQGYPPRKKNDTSMGDAFNWEWMVHCASERRAELVIITRDTDYGVAIDRKCYPNDHLQQEFRERVSKRRKVVLFDRLTDGLKYLNIAVSKKEVAAESEWLGEGFSGTTADEFNRWMDRMLRKHGKKKNKVKDGPLLLLPAGETPVDGDENDQAVFG